ncbi:TonB-dependent receptor [Pseudoalteromonas arctica]|uniref:TonB-dependent receptor n=1 Tax=Pseudoalteromonas arctica TaxID=394751 RepID=A0A7Y0DSR0_9GAMM|nr:TonB-dependent receptor [Pseudoalteromonas arctica]
MCNTSRMVDLQAAYRITESTKISIGVNNLFDEEPPFAF